MKNILKLKELVLASDSTLKTIFFIFTSVGIGKGLSVLRELIIAYYYGISVTVDFFMLAFTWLTWFSGLWMSVTYSVVIPLVSKAEARDRKLFESEFIGLSFFLGLLLTGFIVIVSFYFIRYIFYDLSEETLIGLTRTFLFLSPLSFISTIAVSYLIILLGKDAILSTLSEAVAPAVASLFLIFYISVWNFDPDSSGLVIGCLIGYFIWVFVLIWWSGRFHLIHRPSFRFRSKLWKDFYKSFRVMFLASTVLSLTALIDQKMALPLGPGSVSTLGYANRVLGLLFAVSSLVLTRTFLPSFSSGLLGRKDMPMRALRWSLFMLLLASIFTALGWKFSNEIVIYGFSRGNFTMDDAHRVGNVLRYGFLQLPFYVAGSVLVCYVTSLSKYNLLLLMAVIMVAVKVLFNYLLIRNFGVSGILISGVIMYLVSFAISLVYVIFRYDYKITKDLSK